MMKPPENGDLNETSRDERLVDALRQQLGLSDSPTLNKQKIDQAIAFLEAVKQAHARDQSKNTVEPAQLRSHFERGRRRLVQWWRAQRIVHAVAAVAGLVALSIVGYLFESAPREQGESQPVWRGEGPSAAWQAINPGAEASRLADRLVGMRCGATIRSARTVTYVDIDLESSGCNVLEAAATLATYGLTVQPNGRASLRIEAKPKAEAQ